jgi:hypothetical protein
MLKEECQELKNIKYKTMLLSGNKKVLSSVIRDISNLDFILDEESEQNKKETWNKLDKSIKMNKITEYIKTLTSTYTLTGVEVKTLRDFLSSNLDKKNLQRNKDVIYLKEVGKLENIPTLHFNNTTRKFSLKKIQGQSSVKLGPTRKNKSHTNKGSPSGADTNRSSTSSHKSQKNKEPNKEKSKEK